MFTRRTFLHQLSMASAGAMAGAFFSEESIVRIRAAAEKLDSVSPEKAAGDEDFWYEVQQAFRQSPHFINLENGYFSPQPVSTLEALQANQRMINEQPSFYMRRRRDEEHKALKQQLAEFAGCSPEELVITRNTTESLDTIIHGLKLEAGDEAILTYQDYGSMVEAFKQQARRFGIINKFISLPLHPQNAQEIVDRFEEAITPKTKVMLVTQLINLSGQVLPVRELCEMAHGHGVEVIVDGAHAFAHIDFKISDLDCDYFGASLHKWLCCPLGTGILYVKKDKISQVWPLFGDNTWPDDDIRKFEHIGTYPPANTLSIANAIRFHEAIGSARKEARLRYLKNYWAEKADKIDKVVINTPWPDAQCGGLGNFAIEGMDPVEISNRLYDEFRIFTVAIKTREVNGVRVTPHLYTRLEDLDKLVEAIGQLAN